MKNKALIIIVSTLSFIFLVFLGINTNNAIREYDYNFNVLLDNLLFKIKEEYPDMDITELVTILNDDKLEDNNLLKKYGIDIKKESISVINNNTINKMYISNGIIITIYILVLIIFLLIYNKLINQRINKITKYVEEINRKNYKLDILSNKENSLSLLQNEIYKTMVMLKESADNSLNDKKQLKESLSDISHQLKTPLTSISIMLDNIIDDTNMDSEIREDFILDIKREINNINFLVQNILKLSQFDANTIKFSSEYISVKDILDESVKKVLALSDLKNVKVSVKCDKSINIKGDLRWETEALTNIIKNCIEHAIPESTVSITATDNRIYSMISIKNQGKTIPKKEITHIFERFYKGQDSSKDSVGIGLALAKTIVEKDGGTITVESKNNETEFRVKYFN